MLSKAYLKEKKCRLAYIKAGGTLPVPRIPRRSSSKVPKNLPCAKIVTSQPGANLRHPRTYSEWMKKRLESQKSVGDESWNQFKRIQIRFSRIIHQ
jgi:hypothetical protein